MNEITFRAMGTDMHIASTAATPRHLEAARRRIDDLERKWSRFRSDSEMCALNAGDGEPVRVSRDTISLIRLSIEGMRMTGGLFNPMILDAMVAAGYDRSFDELPRDITVTSAEPLEWEADAIQLDDVAGTVTLPRGCQFDPGGIGKGFAADLIAGDLIDAGADGACVGAGGDVRCAGDAPAGEAWRVAIEHPGRGIIATAEIRDGAVATSSRMNRRWTAAGQEHHHLIDPRTGRPAATDVESVTVVASSGWRADVLAKAAFLAGPHDAAQLPGVIDIYTSVVGVVSEGSA